MLPSEVLQRPGRGWVRRTAKALTALALVSVPLVALTQLGPGLVPGLTGGAAAASAQQGATADSPLTFDAPARTVERAAVEQKDASRAAARLAAAKKEEAALLDDWHFTQFSYGRSYNYDYGMGYDYGRGWPYMRSNELYPYYFGFAASSFAFQPAPFFFGFGYPAIFIIPIPQFAELVIIDFFSFPRFFHRHQGPPPIIIIVINPPPTSPYR